MKMCQCIVLPLMLLLMWYYINSLLLHIILSQRSEVKGENPVKFYLYMPLRDVFGNKWLHQQLLPVQVNTINY